MFVWGEPSLLGEMFLYNKTQREYKSIYAFWHIFHAILYNLTACIVLWNYVCIQIMCKYVCVSKLGVGLSRVFRLYYYIFCTYDLQKWYQRDIKMPVQPSDTALTWLLYGVVWGTSPLCSQLQQQNADLLKVLMICNRVWKIHHKNVYIVSWNCQIFVVFNYS